MTREKILFIVAVLIMIAPHLGLTNLMEQIVLFVFGLIVIICAYGIYFDKKARAKKATPSPTKRRVVQTEHPPTPLKKDTYSGDNGFTMVKKKEESTEENNFNI